MDGDKTINKGCKGTSEPQEYEGNYQPLRKEGSSPCLEASVSSYVLLLSVEAPCTLLLLLPLPSLERLLEGEDPTVDSHLSSSPHIYVTRRQIAACNHPPFACTRHRSDPCGGRARGGRLRAGGESMVESEEGEVARLCQRPAPKWDKH